MSVRLKRAYDEPTADDGYRVLVDRIWPRGIRRPDVAIDDWAAALAPSDDLRRWFGHRTDRWREFTTRYRRELEDDPARRAILDGLASRAEVGPVTLVYGARDRDHNQAVVLAEVLAERGAGPDVRPPTPVVAAIERLLVGGIGVTALALGEAGEVADLTLAQWRVLVIVSEGEGIRIGELATRLRVAVPSASRIVRRLERRGFVTAERDETDRRATVVRMTAAGRHIRDAVMARRRDLMADAFEGDLGDATDDTAAALDAIARALARFA